MRERRRRNWIAWLALAWLAAGRNAGAEEGVPNLLGTWVGVGVDGPIELRFDAAGKLRLAGREGDWRWIQGHLGLALDHRTELHELRSGPDTILIEGPLFPDGLELARPGTSSAQRLLAPAPDAETVSSDRPRQWAPDGRASFLVPPGFEAQWHDRDGFGELRLASSREPQLILRVRVGKLSDLDRSRPLKELTAALASALAPDLPEVRPAGAPKQGRLGRWPARSVEIGARRDGTELRGWTAAVVARPWYAQVVSLAPTDSAERAVDLARQLFHGLRLRPGQPNRLQELRLVGAWAPAQAGTQESLTFGSSGGFSWTRAGAETRGRFQVRGPALLLTWADAEKELELRCAAGEEPLQKIELSGRVLLRLPPGGE
jgi:hypothetical protein